MKFAIGLLFPLLVAVPGFGALFPDSLGPYHLASVHPVALSDAPLWTEYGLQESEQATFAGGGKTVTATAYRLSDTTSALAVFDWQRAAGSRPSGERISKLTNLSVDTVNGTVLATGNYVLAFEGYRPTAEEISDLVRAMPRLENGPLPTLPGYFPVKDLAPNSERYILGPASLQKFAPEIEPSIAAFRMGAEGQFGLFHSPKGDLKLVLFTYPTPAIARDRLAQFDKTPGLIAKRTGPLLAVVAGPSDPNEAERLLSAIRYEASITVGDKPPSRKDNPGNLLLNILILIGILIVFALASGLVFGGLRILFRRGGETGEGDSMISLHLTD